MHILFFSDNFPPETNAPSARLWDHARSWVRAGHSVTVVTCAPNFPEGRVHPGWKNRWYCRESMGGIEVVRVKTYMAPNAGVLRRTLDHLSFLVTGCVAGLLQRRPDVVVASSPPLFAALAAWCVAFLRRRPFVFELRDLWPASIVAVGALRPGPCLRVLEGLELFLYRRAAAVVALTEAFRRDLVRRGVESAKIHVVTGGVDRAVFHPRVRNAELAREVGVEGRFVVGYLGTHGMAHALENVLEAAELLRDRPEICFLFVGPGAERERLVRGARERGLQNVVFQPRVSRDWMPRIWSLCDLGLIHLRAEPVFETVLPSKLFEALGMGVPVLLAAPNGEAAKVLKRGSSGVWVPAENPRALAQAVLRLHDHPEQRALLGRAALEQAADFDRERLARRMLEVLQGAGGNRRWRELHHALTQISKEGGESAGH
jgi:glycosyltransferase involved in cell wall biosynthesis